MVLCLAMVAGDPVRARDTGPVVPESDATVLQRLPAGDAMQRLGPLRRVLDAQPHNLRIALRLARAYIKLSRDTGSPRFLGYAEAVLEPWRHGPASVWVLKATIAQRRHYFDRALAMLDKALAAAPRNLQAWVTRATILQVQGDIAGALAACEHLRGRTPPLVYAVCHNSARALGGHLAHAYEQLQAMTSARSEAAKTAIRVWALTELGGMAVRLGRPQAAEAHFRRALALDPGNIYLLAAYADLLLARGDTEAVTDLLQGYESQNVLLMRLALAGGDSADGRRWQRMLAARFEAASRRGRTTHRREHARFLLAQGEIQSALKLARANWQVQHEPADIRILLRAARAAGRPEAAQPALAWMRAHDYQDARIADLRRRLAKAVGE